MNSLLLKWGHKPVKKYNQRVYYLNLCEDFTLMERCQQWRKDTIASAAHNQKHQKPKEKRRRRRILRQISLVHKQCDLWNNHHFTISFYKQFSCVLNFDGKVCDFFFLGLNRNEALGSKLCYDGLPHWPFDGMSSRRAELFYTPKRRQQTEDQLFVDQWSLWSFWSCRWFYPFINFTWAISIPTSSYGFLLTALTIRMTADSSIAIWERSKTKPTTTSRHSIPFHSFQSWSNHRSPPFTTIVVYCYYDYCHRRRRRRKRFFFLSSNAFGIFFHQKKKKKKDLRLMRLCDIQQHR